jgi:hypothetical protein
MTATKYSAQTVTVVAQTAERTDARTDASSGAPMRRLV